MNQALSEQKTYGRVFIALLLLAGITAFVSEINLGPFNVTAALAIALVKAALVAAYFMHLRESGPMFRLAAIISLAWLLIMISLTIADYATRSWSIEPKGL
jgi:cytochrome c oxidase subunit IV